MRAPGADPAEAQGFYRDAAAEGIAVKHVLYAPEDPARLTGPVGTGTVSAEALSVVMVPGTYDGSTCAEPDRIAAFRDAFAQAGPAP